MKKLKKGFLKELVKKKFKKMPEKVSEAIPGEFSKGIHKTITEEIYEVFLRNAKRKSGRVHVCFFKEILVVFLGKSLEKFVEHYLENPEKTQEKTGKWSSEEILR